MKREPRCKSALAPVTDQHVRGAFFLGRRYQRMAKRERNPEKRERYLNLANDFYWDAERYQDEINERN